MAAIQGQPPVWDDFLAGYAAGVDTPFSTCWRELAAAHPDAPVLLSHRGSAEVWHRSMDVTGLGRIRDMLAMDDDVNPMMPLFRAMWRPVDGASRSAAPLACRCRIGRSLTRTPRPTSSSALRRGGES